MSAEIDLGFSVAELPPLPWTLSTLGAEKFCELATLCGAGISQSALDPSLDPSAFALGCGNRLIQASGLADDSEQAQAIRAHAETVQDEIDATLPPPAGTPRAPGAPPLRGAVTKTTKREF